MKFIKVNQYSNYIPVFRKFNCNYCKKIVEVKTEDDKRFKFCCAKCEKNFWRKKSKEKRRLKWQFSILEQNVEKIYLI